MTKKKVVLLILVTMLLIGFTVYSILHEDLSTVQTIFGQSTATESKEFTNNDENEVDNTIVEGVLNLEENDTASTQDTEEDLTNNTINSSIDEVASKLSVNNTTNSVTISSNSNTSTTATANNTTSNSTKEIGSVSLEKVTSSSQSENTSSLNQSSSSTGNPIVNNSTTTVKDSLKVGANGNNTSVNNTAKNTNNVNNKVNTISNSIVNKTKLPAAGNKTILIWIVIAVVAISAIAIISNIRYKDIPLK